ncbi:hypothetical protein HON01_11765 [Candidatus Woesearchaeota archaeon]|jgi:DNA-binding response OmpR family regulator|nr:hypothetical protein [archaeon]MBT5023489.1 hypothetical protein [Candidatus Woesearchaeota archaeon]MBT4022600.1 hypothetical protein [archaeon]MBT4272040.1 hypothetical protein [archaeon]MBT4461137.1 hypothetical protein [archaeon]
MQEMNSTLIAYIGSLPEKIDQTTRGVNLEKIVLGNETEFKVTVTRGEDVSEIVLGPSRGAILAYFMAHDEVSERDIFTDLYGGKPDEEIFSKVRTHINELKRQIRDVTQFDIIGQAAAKKYKFYGVVEDLEFCDLFYNPVTRVLRTESEENLKLNPIEGLVFEYLVGREGQIVDYRDIYNKIYTKTKNSMSSLRKIINSVIKKVDTLSKEDEPIYKISKKRNEVVVGKLKRSGDVNIQDLLYDNENRIIHFPENKNKKPSFLTGIESKVLNVLLRYSGEIITPDKINLEVWGGNYSYVPVVIANIRDKLGDSLQEQKYIQTIGNGIGYSLIKEIKEKK